MNFLLYFTTALFSQSKRTPQIYIHSFLIILRLIKLFKKKILLHKKSFRSVLFVLRNLHL